MSPLFPGAARGGGEVAVPLVCHCPSISIAPFGVSGENFEFVHLALKVLRSPVGSRLLLANPSVSGDYAMCWFWPASSASLRFRQLSEGVVELPYLAGVLWA